jgi:hypothetical protein
MTKMNSGAQIKVGEGAGNFWQYVSSSERERTVIDRDRALEYIRKHCLDVRVFKLVLMGTSIALSQVRKTDKEILALFADFLLEDQYPLPDDPAQQRVMMRMEIRKQAKEESGGKVLSTFYEMALMINVNGVIVDVDYRPLERQLARQSRFLQ